MSVDRLEHIISVFGSFDENLRLIENDLNVRITDRNSELNLSGDDEDIMYAERAISGLRWNLAAKGESIEARSVRYIIGLVKEGHDDKIGELARDVICITAKASRFKAKTLVQKRTRGHQQKHGDAGLSAGRHG
jgi:phosphate starvation-inducible PhoH-like protein